MRISIVVAMDENRLIGVDNCLPWRLPADLKHFKSVTMGKPILMGRKTHESIGRVLPGRSNIVVTRDPDYQAEGCLVAHNIDDAVGLAGDAAELMVIGGAEFYEQCLPRAQRIYLTQVHSSFEGGDSWFPHLVRDQWRELEREDHFPDADNPHAYSFIVLDRIKPVPVKKI